MAKSKYATFKDKENLRKLNKKIRKEDFYFKKAVLIGVIIGIISGIIAGIIIHLFAKLC
ncbi:MAG: hypothetical protein U9Q69_01035 [Nanoarchaeota archaeon]|nr:hypothetical protein [Nanoarchaeota archaeon]